MKNNILYLILICFANVATAQSVEIYTHQEGMNPVAVIDAQADSSGVLFPRTDTSTILEPVEGLMIYDTVMDAYVFYNGLRWQSVLSTTFQFWYVDRDEDGYGDPYSAVYAPEAPTHYVSNDLDCDDNNAAINPDADEICDGIDNDCNGMIDDGAPGDIVFYPDTDMDGYGDINDPGIMSCTAPVGHVDNNWDCNDGDPAINPDAQEICNGIDDDCDADVDDNDESLVSETLYYIDSDLDGYGDKNDMSPVFGCSQPVGRSDNNLDCDDNNPNINPEADEVCSNEIDDNCNMQTDEMPCVVE